MFAALFPALAFAAAATLAQDSTADVAQAFIHADLVPDVLPSFNPSGLLSVVYTNNATGGTIDVTPGKNLTVQDVLLRPQVSLTSDNSTLANEMFMLVLAQNTSAAQIRHILAGGLRPNCSLAEGALLVNSTPAVSDYLNPNPPAGSDPHRYTALLYVQPENFDIEVSRFVNASTPIFGFNVSVFAQELGLGIPVAGNFFFAGPASSSSADQSLASSGAAATTQSHPSSGLTSVSTSSIGVGLVIALVIVLLV